jgi:tetratricopeptide (TPR) repeat protein
MSDRIKQLEQFIAEDPHDPFNHYALGLEYINVDSYKALTIFKAIVNSHVEYLPVYYQLGKLYQHLGEKENAAETFNKGIALAKSKNDLKTLRELSAALEELNDE